MTINVWTKGVDPAPQPERQPLTTPQYVEALGPLLYQVVCSAGTLRRIVRAIEAAHGIKEQP